MDASNDVDLTSVKMAVIYIAFVTFGGTSHRIFGTNFNTKHIAVDTFGGTSHRIFGTNFYIEPRFSKLIDVIQIKVTLLELLNRLKCCTIETLLENKRDRRDKKKPS